MALESNLTAHFFKPFSVITAVRLPSVPGRITLQVTYHWLTDYTPES